MSNKRIEISFGKFAIGSEKKVNEVIVSIEYGDDTGHGLPRFSACGEVWNASHTDIIMGGQCLDELNNILCHSDISAEKHELWKNIYGLWKRNHLNDMCAYANETQKEAVDEYMRTHDNKYDYTSVCDYLKEKGIYYVYVDGKKCGYGEEWYYRPISVEDMKLIETIFSTEN